MSESVTETNIEVMAISPDMARHIGYLDGWRAVVFQNPFLQTKVVSQDHATEYYNGYYIGKIERVILPDTDNEVYRGEVNVRNCSN